MSSRNVRVCLDSANDIAGGSLCGNVRVIDHPTSAPSLSTNTLQASVLRAALGEITTQESENWAYPLWSIGWDLSIIMGPLVGATLSQPAEQYPDSWLGRIVFLQKFPFFLPCATAAAFALMAFLLIFFLFEEVSL